MTKLLAEPGDYDGRFFLFRWLGIRKSSKWAGYKTKLGYKFHGPGKFLLRKLIKMAYNYYKPAIERKQSEGYIKGHVQEMDRILKHIIHLKTIKVNGHAIQGFASEHDVNKVMFEQLGGLVLTMLDEDSAYDMPALVALKEIHENWPKFEISAEQSYQLLNFDNFYRDLMSWNEPLPLDDGKAHPHDKFNAKRLMEEKDDGMEYTG